MHAKHLKGILVVATTFVVIGHLIPYSLDWQPIFFLEDIPTQRMVIKDESSEERIKPKIVNALELLDSALTPSKKRKDWRRKIPQWNLHRGEPFLLQVHKAIQTLNINNCLVTSTRESKLNNFVIVDYTCPEKAPSSIRLQLGDQYQANSSKLAIVFQVDTTSIPLLNALNSFTEPLNLMFNPKNKNKQLLKDIARIPNSTKVIQAALEPQNYSSYMHGKVIRIFYEEKQIREYLDPILEDNHWIQFRHGSLARNNPQLLDRLFKILKSQDISLIDTQKKFQSNLRKKCVSYNLKCFFPKSASGNKTTIERLESAMYRARKTGENILVLPATEENFNVVNENLERIKNQGTQLVSLDSI